jgi:hypothetical protein
LNDQEEIMKLSKKDLSKLSQLGQKIAMGFGWSPTHPGVEESQEWLDEHGVLDDRGCLNFDRETVLERSRQMGLEHNQLDLSGGLRITYSVAPVEGEPGIFHSHLAVSRRRGRVSEKLVCQIRDALGFGEASPSKNPASGVWHVMRQGAPPTIPGEN